MDRYPNDVFLQVGDPSGKRILNPGQVLESSDNEIVIELTKPINHEFTPNQGLLLFFEDKREFKQQPAEFQNWLTSESSDSPAVSNDSIIDTETQVVTESEVQTEQNLTLVIKTIGEPISAESRQCYRTSTVLSQRFARIAKEECPLMDISMTGLSAISKEAFTIGQSLEISITWEDQEFAGIVTVQSILELDDTRTRYGFHCIDQDPQCRELQKGLGKMSIALQREQLRRQSGQ